ncbi:MAG: TM2 domain-containing protein [Vicinamibacterales bacterium]
MRRLEEGTAASGDGGAAPLRRETAAPGGCSPDGRPYRREDRRRKLQGTWLCLTAVPPAAWLYGHPLAGRWAEAAPVDWLLAFAALVAAVNLAFLGAFLLAVGFGVTRIPAGAGQWRRLLRAVGGVNVASLGAPFAALQDDPSLAFLGARGEAVGAGLLVCCGAAGVLAIHQLRAHQKHHADSAAQALAADARAPVVYLRSFQDDGEMVVRGATPLPAWMNAIVSAGSAMSIEQELAAILRRLGPVVAIGRPGEPVPDLGAARFYVPHDRWQAAVLDLLDRAALVVVRIGTSEGVRWEIDQVLERVAREKVLFVLLGSGRDVAAAIGALERRLGVDLPLDALERDEPAGRRWFRYLVTLDGLRRPIGAFVAFGPRGDPSVEFVRAFEWHPRDLVHAYKLSPYAPGLRAASRRTFTRLGHGWIEMPRRSMAVLLALTLGWCGAHWWYVGRPDRARRYLWLLPVAFLSVFLAWYDAWRWLMGDRRAFESTTVR